MAKKTDESAGPPPRVESVYLQLPVALTQKELVTAAQTLTDALSRLDEIEEERKECLAGYKSQMAELTATAADLRTKVATGRADATVECERTYDYARGVVTTRRLDTGERVAERAMSTDEKQPEFFPDADTPSEPRKPEA